MPIRYPAMALRLFKIASLLSAITAVLLATMWVLIDRIDPMSQVGVANHWGVSVCAPDRLCVFNGPHSNDGVIPYNAVPKAGLAPYDGRYTTGFNRLGIWYKHMPCPDGSWWWTVELNFAYPLTVALILPVVWLIWSVRRSARRVVPRGFPVEGHAKAG
jgi:hypothetical protein